MTDATLGFVFPGQGSQKTGMLAELFAHYACVRDTMAEASDTLGYDLWGLISGDDQAALDLTETTQPVLLASSVAVWRAWQAAGGPLPAVMAGHSLGEFSALTCAGVLAFDDALKLVRKRGAAMQTAVPVGVGSMAAIIGLEGEQITQICADVASSRGEVVSAVNFNSPGQVVIAGQATAVDAAIKALLAAGAKRALPLSVSAPFHTALMQPAADILEQALQDITLHAPNIPVVHNVHARTESDPQRIRALLVQQTCSPVLWTDCVIAMAARGITRVAECGPGKVLGGLNRRIDSTLESFFLQTPAGIEELLGAAAT